MAFLLYRCQGPHVVKIPHSFITHSFLHFLWNFVWEIAVGLDIFRNSTQKLHLTNPSSLLNTHLYLTKCRPNITGHWVRFGFWLRGLFIRNCEIWDARTVSPIVLFFSPSFFFRFSLILFNISLPLQHFKQNNYQIAMIKCCSC